MRKTALDTIAVLAKVVPNTLKPYKVDLVGQINELKFDKMKPVRDSSLEALDYIKDVDEMGAQ
jgi:hypothetical protein